MTFAAAILVHTPFYVWLLLAWVAWQGVAALRPRTQAVWRVLSVPGLFIVAGLLPLFWRAGGAGLLAAWGAGALVLLPLGWRTGPRLLSADPAIGTVTRAGSLWPLVRNVLVFVVQYVLVVASVLRAEERAVLLLAGRAVSGATAGYFAGWAASAWLQYRGVHPRGVRGRRSGQNVSPGGSVSRS